MSFTAFNQSGLNTTHLTPLSTITSRSTAFSNSPHASSVHSFSASNHLVSNVTNLSGSQITNSIDSFKNFITTQLNDVALSQNVPNLLLETDRTESDSTFTTNIIIIFLVFWNIYGFFIQIKLLFFTEIKEFSDQVYDNCDKETSFFKYMIRLKYSEPLNGYQLNNGTLMIDLLDVKDHYITRLTIPPEWLSKITVRKSSKKSFYTVKFRLNRKQEFPDIGSIK